VLTEVKTERGDEAKERRRKQEGILGKGAPGKNFSRKFCGLKIYPYVCSAKTWRLRSDEDLGAAKEKGVSFLVLTKSSFLSKFPLFLCFCFSEKEVEEVSVL
jgi:hypothetical protein